MKYVIIGMGQFGRALALNLAHAGREVTILDEKRSIVNEMKDDVTYALSGDASDPRTLQQLDLLGDDLRVIVAIGENFERSILITAQLKELGVRHIFARAVNPIHSRLLQMIGVEGQIRAEEMAAEMLAARFVNESLMHFRKIDRSHALAEVHLPNEWVGKMLRDVCLRTRFRLNLLTVRRGVPEMQSADVLATPDEPVIDFPTPELVFENDDVLVLFGQEKDLVHFAERFGV
ncbi:MAG: TrkA family potassium uptake protein [Akkermansia sp.]|nr:TrkA family potassium uptake protein [Akkermansia sp.]